MYVYIGDFLYRTCVLYMFWIAWNTVLWNKDVFLAATYKVSVTDHWATWYEIMTMIILKIWYANMNVLHWNLPD
jgi:hypothetical protein